jgi:KDO2-lipid IV(A) lauroyltransferase
MYGVALRASKIAPKIPRPVRRQLAALIGTAAWAVAGRARRHVSANVWHARGAPAQQDLAFRIRTQQIVRRIFCNCISNYLELFTRPTLSKQAVLDRIEVRGVEHFEEAAALNRGVVIASAHLGPFEYLTSWMPARGFELTIPVQKMRDDRMLRLMLEKRISNDVSFVPVTGFGAVRAPARLPLGPVNLAIQTGAPLIGAFGWRNGSRDVVEFVPISFALPDHERGNRELLQALLLRRLEKIIGDHLDEWVVFEPVWQ